MTIVVIDPFCPVVYFLRKNVCSQDLTVHRGLRLLPYVEGAHAGDECEGEEDEDGGARHVRGPPGPDITAEEEKYVMGWRKHHRSIQPEIPNKAVALARLQAKQDKLNRHMGNLPMATRPYTPMVVKHATGATQRRRKLRDEALKHGRRIKLGRK